MGNLAVIIPHVSVFSMVVRFRRFLSTMPPITYVLESSKCFKNVVVALLVRYTNLTLPCIIYKGSALHDKPRDFHWSSGNPLTFARCSKVADDSPRLDAER